ncbi:MAG: LysR family transcriptional regulator [Bacilli bacterium]|jgi:DNA-binding transcriptional LysR family regulator|nr:LysR family transcriptional regulator [Bacilli bacterium]
MDINYESYKIFYHVALNQSISKAADKLLISQPAVSYQIKVLEEQLGITLFVRTKKGVTLTDEGKILYSYISKGIENFINGENALTNLKNLDYGIIRIGASTTVSKHVLMPYLKIFHKLYPNIEINITNNLTEELMRELRNGNLDILILNLPMKEGKDLDIKNILEVQDIFVANKDYYDILNKKISLNDLNNYPLLFQKKPSNTRDYLDNYLNTNKIKLIPKMEIVSYNLIMDFIKIGFGIGYATKEFIKEELNNGDLYELNVIPKIPKRFIGAVTLKQTIPNFSVNKLIDLMTKKDVN